MTLVHHSDPALRTVSELFDFSAPGALEEADSLSKKLESLMRERSGLGLSACQIGVNLRVFCMRTEPDVTIFNPRIVDVSEEMVELEEGCLSFKNLIFKISRPRLVKLRFQLKDGETRTMKFDGMSARVIQHEMEHLNGKVFFNGASRLRIEMAVKKAKRLGSSYSVGELFRLSSS